MMNGDFNLFVHGELTSIFEKENGWNCRIKLLKKISACMSGKR